MLARQLSGDDTISFPQKVLVQSSLEHYLAPQLVDSSRVGPMVYTGI